MGVTGSKTIGFIFSPRAISHSVLMNKPNVYIIMGPTASGKTALGIELAQQLNGEIISVDSALVYKGMDIGTAKPDEEEQQGIPHHLIDIIDPLERFSVGEFCSSTRSLVTDINQRGKTPILVGGTMLYFHALLEGIAILPEASEKVRNDIDARAKDIGWQGMHAELQKVDPQAAARIHFNDPQRIQRALEVFYVSGKTQTTWLSEQQDVELPFVPIKYAIAPRERSSLHQKIALRFDLMLQQGLLDEVRGFYDRGDLDLSMPSMRSVGYRQVWNYFDVIYDKQEMRERSIIATRQLAKRQFTWLRKQTDAYWLESEDNSSLDNILQHHKKISR
jgi:tRNA dimethylallyltransferase